MKEAAEALLEKSGLLKRSKVRDVWKTVKWTDTLLISGDAAAASAGNSEICLRSNSGDKSAGPVIKAFGTILYRQLSTPKQAAWRRKLLAVSKDQAQEFQHRLSKHGSFKGVVESYQSAVDRLIAIHFCNAMIASRVDYAETANIDIFEWPQTAPMASGRKPYSLVPIWSAYAPHLLLLGDALLDYCQRQFSSILEMSLRTSAEALLEEVVN